MKFLPVIGWIAAGRCCGQQAFLGPAVPPFLDRFQIGEEVDRATDLRERIAESVLRHRIVSGLDIAPVLRDERPKIGENTLSVWHRAMMQSRWHRHWPADAGGEQLL